MVAGAEWRAAEPASGVAVADDEGGGDGGAVTSLHSGRTKVGGGPKETTEVSGGGSCGLHRGGGVPPVNTGGGAKGAIVCGDGWPTAWLPVRNGGPRNLLAEWRPQMGMGAICVPKEGPGLASKIFVPIEARDIIVAGTEGLFDNLFDAEIVGVLAAAKADGHGTPEEMARALAWAAAEAYIVAAGQETSFSLACPKAKVPWRRCGNPDDVTVVVASVW